jgi:hypothetical protein
MGFLFIEFRDSAVGRQAYVQGSTLAVWEAIMLARGYQSSATAVARHLDWPEAKVEAAFRYAAAFPQQINEALAENDAVDFADLERMLPQAEEFVVHESKGC